MNYTFLIYFVFASWRWVLGARGPGGGGGVWHDADRDHRRVQCRRLPRPRHRADGLLQLQAPAAATQQEGHRWVHVTTGVLNIKWVCKREEIPSYIPFNVPYACASSINPKWISEIGFTVLTHYKAYNWCKNRKFARTHISFTPRLKNGLWVKKLNISYSNNWKNIQ